MAVYLDSHMLQLGLKDICARLALIQVDHNASHIKAFILKLLNQAQYIHIIGDPQILSLIHILVQEANMALMMAVTEYDGSQEWPDFAETKIRQAVEAALLEQRSEAEIEDVYKRQVQGI